MGEAKVKYFQHAGALLTADGTDAELIQFEGVPPGYTLNQHSIKNVIHVHTVYTYINRYSKF